SAPVAPAGQPARLTSVVVFACRSRTNTSSDVSPSAASRLDETDSKATKRPSAEIEGCEEAPSPLAPAPPARLTRLVVLVCKSRTNTSGARSPSAGSRFVARESKATKRPSAEIGAAEEALFPSAPAAPPARLTSVVVFVCRSRTNTSPPRSPSLGSRLVAKDSKATKRPSAEIEGELESEFPLAPAAPLARLTSVV